MIPLWLLLLGFCLSTEALASVATSLCAPNGDCIVGEPSDICLDENDDGSCALNEPSVARAARGGAGDAGAFAMCRAGAPGWGYDAASNTYGATCGNYPWSSVSGGVSGTSATPASYLTPTTSGGNAFDIACTGPGAGTGSDGVSYNVATALQPGAPAVPAVDSATSGTLTDAGVSFGTGNKYRDHIVRMMSGVCSGVRRRITSHTNTVLTIEGTWDGAGGDGCPGAPTFPANGDTYTIYDDVGSACWAAGESVRMNFSADAMLAQDHTRQGGTVYFPLASGSPNRIYVHRACGRKGNASTTTTFNACPVLRHPRDTNFVHVAQQVGNIAWRFEGGPDLDGEENGRIGAWVVDDTGSIAGGAFAWRDPGGPNPGVTSFPRTGLRIGPASFNNSTERQCFANASGDCQPGSSSNQGISSVVWGRVFTLAHTGDITDETAICVSSSDAASGTCRDDRRVVCTVNGDCTGVGLAGPCDDAAAAIDYETDTLHRRVYGWLAFLPADFPESGGVGSAGSESAWVEITTAPLATCGSGLSVSADSFKWPVRASKIPNTTGTLLIVDPNESDGMLRGGWSGYTWSPNNYYMRDLDGDGVSDNGDCLSGGAGQGASATDDEPECDDAEGPTLYGGLRHVIEHAVHTNCSAVPVQGGFSCFDGDTNSYNHQARSLVVHRPRRGYLGDLSDVRLRDFQLRDCLFDASFGFGLNTAFVSLSRVEGFTISNCHSEPLISTGSGNAVRITDGEFIGTHGTGIVIRRGNNVLIENVRFASHRGTGIHIVPEKEMGSISLRSLSGLGRMQFTGSSSVPPEAFISFDRFYQTSGFESPLRQLTIDDVHISTVTSNGCLVFLDDDTSPAEAGPIEVDRRKISITNSSIDGLNGATGQRVVCVDVVGTGETGDCAAGGGTCDSGDDQGIFTQRYMPVLRNNHQNGVPFPDQPWPVMNASEAGDCDDVGRVGAVVRIVDDTSAGTCADSNPADGILDGTGTAVSVCKCLASTAWGAL